MCFSAVICRCVCACVVRMRAVYHEPDGVRHLAEVLGGVGGDRRHPAAPQEGVEPRLVHRVDGHPHVIGQVLPGGGGGEGGHSITPLQSAGGSFFMAFYESYQNKI